MALTSTLYRFTVDLSDVDRNLYQTLEFRAAMHPSESVPFFITRVLAYCLNYRDGLEFSGGISTPDDPALKVMGLMGIHKASKSAKQVLIYTHKDAHMLAEDFKTEGVHKLEAIGIYSMDQRFLNALGGTLNRDNHWEMTRNEGELYVGVGQETYPGKLIKQ